MYKEIHYVASKEDEAAFRDFLDSLGVHILPERPGTSASLTDEAVEEDRRRLLSLKPINDVKVSETNPYPHYSPVAQPLIEWDVPLIRAKVIVTGYLRHRASAKRKGQEFADIDRLFDRIKQWMQIHWRPLNGFNFIGPGAARLVADEGYEWSSVDIERTTFQIVHADGEEEEVSFSDWLKFGDKK